MADLYGAKDSSPSLSSSGALDRDDISVFLHNIIYTSSSSASALAPVSSSGAKHMHSLAPPAPPPQEAMSSAGQLAPPEDRRPVSRSAGVSGSGCRLGEPAASTATLNFSDPVGYFPPDAIERTRNSFYCVGGMESDVITSSAKRGMFPVETGFDEVACDTEGHEGSDVPSNPNHSRGSSKRSRAAEVHNLSEKRRRSRINEKMKALQMLIPNSNKTDKASMLDEAIEYLKQLQLQVQMLSMRNGLSLHPVYLPGILQPVQLPQTGMVFDEGNGLPNMNGEAGTFSANQPMQTAFDISSRCNAPNQPIAIPTISQIINPETSFSLEPSIPAHYGHLNLSSSPKEICREDTLQLLQSEMGIPAKNSSGVS